MTLSELGLVPVHLDSQCSTKNVRFLWLLKYIVRLEGGGGEGVKSDFCILDHLLPNLMMLFTKKRVFLKTFQICCFFWQVYKFEIELMMQILLH